MNKRNCKVTKYVYLIEENVSCFSNFFLKLKSNIHVEGIKEEASTLDCFKWTDFIACQWAGKSPSCTQFPPSLYFFKVDLSASQDFLCNTYERKISIHIKEKQFDLCFLTHFLYGASSTWSEIECGIFVGCIKTHTHSQEVSVSPAAKATFKCARSP